MTEVITEPAELLVPDHDAKNHRSVEQHYLKLIFDALSKVADALATHNDAAAIEPALNVVRLLALYDALNKWSNAYNQLAIQGPVKAIELAAVLGAMLANKTLAGRDCDPVAVAYNHFATLCLAADMKRLHEEIVKHAIGNDKIVDPNEDADGPDIDGEGLGVTPLPVGFGSPPLPVGSSGPDLGNRRSASIIQTGTPKVWGGEHSGAVAN